MKWRKLGKIFTSNNNHDWMISHAAVPFLDPVRKDVFKIYFSSRNLNNESSIGYVVIDINTPSNILEICDAPVLTKGCLGCFDDSGVMGSCIITVNNQKYLYYIGWNLGVTVPFRNAIGLAISNDQGQTYERAYSGPIIDRTKDEPHFVASNCVIYDNEIFKMWYLSCTTWEQLSNNKLKHHYHIKYAESNDGINWERNGRIAINYRDEYEYAISVPRVRKDKEIYKIWYSYRASKNITTYRIGYAESMDGINWNRRDNEVGIDVSTSGWDSEMICYPYIFDHKGRRYMLYNGNEYGKTGFGLAVLESG